MPTETPSPALIVYLSLLLVAGLGCFVHFVFIHKAPKRIANDQEKVPNWPLTISDFFLGFFAILLVAFLVATAFDLLLHNRVEQRLHQILVAGVVQVAALVALFAFLKAFPAKFNPPFDGRKLGWGEAFKISLYSFLVIIPILWPLAGMWRVVLEFLGLSAEQQTPVQWLAEAETLTLLFAMVFATVILAPVTEELLFRGCLYRFLKARLSLAAALLVSGVLFSIVHVNPLSLLPLFFLGVVLAYAYERTGSIKVPILIHGIFNANTIILIVLTVHLA